SHYIDSPSVANNLETGRPNACNLCHLDQSLAWTAKQLRQWYGKPEPQLTLEQRSYAAGPLWALKGDAGLRALAAYAMGWRAAHPASARGWLPPFLAILLDDRYAAVRHIAHRSLKTLPGYENFKFDYIGSAQARAEGKQRAMSTWRRHWKPSDPVGHKL